MSSLLKCCCAPKLGGEASLPLPPATCNSLRTLDNYKVIGGPITSTVNGDLNCAFSNSTDPSSIDPWDGLIHRRSLHTEEEDDRCAWAEGGSVGESVEGTPVDNIASWEGKNFPGQVILLIEDGSYMTDPYWKLRLDSGAIAHTSWVGVKGSGNSPLGEYHVICPNGNMLPKFLTITPV